MKRQILEDLTKNACANAIELATELYTSKYTDNETRMLYASAMGCNVGLNMYTVIGQLPNLGTSANPIGEFAKMFPATSADSRMESAQYGLDATQSILNFGSVVSIADQLYPSSYNIGSVLTRDRTDDANVYLMFISMAVIGTVLNRYGAPDASYGQGADLPWETVATVKADTTGNACALAAGFLNFFDGADIAQAFLGSNGSSISSVLGVIQSPITVSNPLRPGYGGQARCLADGFTAAQCTAAAIRLRYRGSCTELDPIASVAAGIIGSVNRLWTPPI